MSEHIDKMKDDEVLDARDLEKVKAQSEAKLMRHRLDDYLAVVLGVGSALVLWILQLLDLY